MEGHWPAAFIKMGIPLLTRGHILERKEESSNQVWNQPNVRKRGSLKSFFEKEKVKTWREYKLGRAFMKRSYSCKDIPEVGICNGMIATQLFWRKVAVEKRCDCIEFAGGVARAHLQFLSDMVFSVYFIRKRSEFKEGDDNEV